jgi:hypothetical protein
LLNKALLLKESTRVASPHVGEGQVALGSQAITTYTKIKSLLDKLKGFLLLRTRLIQARTDKNLQWWRQKQRYTTKRKGARKRDRFKKQLKSIKDKYNTPLQGSPKPLVDFSNGISNYILTSPTGPKESQLNSVIFNDVRGEKSESPLREIDSMLLRQKDSPNLLNQGSSVPDKGSSNNLFFPSPVTLGKKMSSKGRRYRSLSLSRYLTATRKPRLVGNNAIRIDNVSNINGSFLNKQEKSGPFGPLSLGSKSLSTTLKKSQIKKRSRHTWKKLKHHQFSLDYYKYRKRHIHGNGKLKAMYKKLKKYKSTNELRQWWWNSFLPRYLNKAGVTSDRTMSTLPYEGVPKQLQVPSGEPTPSQLAIGFTPLSSSAPLLSRREAHPQVLPLIPLKQGNPSKVTSEGFAAPSGEPVQDLNKPRTSNNGQNSSLITSTQSIPQEYPTKLATPFRGLVDGTTGSLEKRTTQSIPFYAGWDESLRKFVITNRLLSRRDAGLLSNNPQDGPNSKSITPLDMTPGFPLGQIKFNNAPLQGLNEGTFLANQMDMPFNAYNIDQFIPTNQSFYAPLGWRRFELRHSILKTWSNQSGRLSSTSVAFVPTLPKGTKTTLIVSRKNLDQSMMSSPQDLRIQEINQGLRKDSGSKQRLLLPSDQKTRAARRIKKRYKLLKQTPNLLMYSPTGPLLTEVLPSHYLSVFDQQYRFPRSRYLKRNTLKTFGKYTLLAMADKFNQQDGSNGFTLRKRVKPRSPISSNMQRKRFMSVSSGIIFPRRTKFNTATLPEKNVLSITSYTERMRPKSPTSSLGGQQAQRTRKRNVRKTRVKTNPLRLRQLRRREFQQILKPLQRYIPQNGGFTWPGDYLRLEVVLMPKLKATNVKKTSLLQKINVQPVGIMPRKYLIEKHNILVLKKKLAQAYSEQRLSTVVQRYKTLLN